MRLPESLRHRAPLLFIGLLVWPLVAQLLIGLPWSIWCERDLQLHGRSVRALAVEERWTRTKVDGPVRELRFAYRAEGRDYRRWLALGDVRLGQSTELHYPPMSPARAVRLPVTGWSEPWDQGLLGRLLISGLLGLVFGGVWIGLWRAAGKPPPASAG